jgi:glutamate racemase
MKQQKPENNIQVDTVEDKIKKPIVSKKRILAAIKNSYGNITVIAGRLNIERKTLYDKIKKFELESAIIDERDKIIDLAENKLIGRVNDGSESMISLVLKTLGRERGYVERVEQNIIGHEIKEIKINIINGDKPKEIEEGK